MYAALLYYHERRREFEELRRERQAIVEDIEAEIDRSDGVDPSDR